MSSPNSVTSGDGFYVSYNDVDVEIYGDTTTALVIGQMEKFYILNGDHRAGYRDIIGDGLGACMDYFRSHHDLVNHRSDKL